MGLEGRFFHTFAMKSDEKWRIEYQGMVLFCVQPGIYMVELFNWLTGEGDVERMYTVDEMMDWQFYPDVNQMKNIYETRYKYDHDLFGDKKLGEDPLDEVEISH